MIESSADVSECGRFRWKLVRRWDLRPMLLVTMMNPSTADANVTDPTISLLCYIASWNGYGGIVVMNLCPLRSSDPDYAFEFMSVSTAALPMRENALRLQEECSKAKAVLVAWGALADRRPGCEQGALEAIRAAAPHLPLYCLGVTASGQPIHPLARGKMKVPKDRKFVEWKAPCPA